MVGTLQFAAIGAFDPAGGPQCVVRAAHVAAGLGYLLLGNCHNEISLWEPPRKAPAGGLPILGRCSLLPKFLHRGKSIGRYHRRLSLSRIAKGDRDFAPPPPAPVSGPPPAPRTAPGARG